MAIKELLKTCSPEFIRWKDEKYATVVLPALSRYVEPDENSQQLMCPISLDWMKNPVQAEDGHIYEKEAILVHLAAWEGRLLEKKLERQLFGLGPIPQQEMRELVQTRSPLRNGDITIDLLHNQQKICKMIKILTCFNYEI